MHEHLDSSLRLMIAGGRLTFEPSARVMYRAYAKFKDGDWPYFLFRWALHRAETSDRVFADNWSIYKDLSVSRSGWIRVHRERAMSTRFPRLPKHWRRGKIERALQKFYQLYISRFDTQRPDDEAPLVLPKPPVDGLEKAGIEFA